MKPIVQISLDLTDIEEAVNTALNDYDAIFTTLKSVHFDSWISIEDGVDGMGQLKRSVGFVNRKIKHYW